MQLPIQKDPAYEVRWNAVGLFYLVHNGIQIPIVLLKNVEEQIEEDIVNLFFTVLQKLFLKLLPFQLHDVMFDKPVPTEPVLLHHSVENLYIVYCLNLLELDGFAPVQCGYVCPYT
jgi:hypothetical protein